jgi:ribosomal protein L11 methyltransferase
MKYLEFTFTLAPSSEAAEDVLAAVLADIGFDSFVHTASLDLPRAARTDNPEEPVFAEPSGEDRFKAYIPATAFSAEALSETVAAFPLEDVRITWQQTEAEDKDWNEEWERNYFQPLVVDGRCVVAGTFHRDVPEAEYRITINPQMSFGTGHHATTSQMISRLLADDISGKEVLDMGCGTSILAILARMRGAAHCTAVDVDEWCVKNSRENIALNNIDGIEVLLGDANSLAVLGPFDLILANINRNILLRDMRQYVTRLRPAGTIYMSGFYTSDVEAITKEAAQQGLTLVDVHTLDDWACVKFRR